MARRPPKEIPYIRKDINAHFTPHLSGLLKMGMGERKDLQPYLHQLETFVKVHVRGISSSQLRKVFDFLKPERGPSHLHMQRPRLANMIAKQPYDSAKYIMLLVDELISLVDKQTIAGFPYFLESLVAFHTYYEALNAKRMDISNLPQQVNRDLAPAVLPDILALQSAENVQPILDSLQQFVGNNVGGITSTQLRNVYDKMLKADSLAMLKSYRPVLAYTAARQANRESIKLIFLVMELLRLTDSKEVFLAVLEVIVSFHKYEEAVKGKKIGVEQLTQELEAHFGSLKSGGLLKRYHKTSFAQIQEKLQGLVLPKTSEEGIKAAQLRRLFDAISSAHTLNDLQRLKPLFLYTLARQSGKSAQRLILLLVKLMEHVQEGQLDSYQAIATDLLSYHRYFEETKSTLIPPAIIKLTL